MRAALPSPRWTLIVVLLPAAAVAASYLCHALRADEGLVPDRSFEQPMPRDRFGHVFARWSGWVYGGECEFRVSDLAHTGNHSLLMAGGREPKIRAWPVGMALDSGRYRVTAYLRGLDIGTDPYGQTTEFMFAGKYLPLRNGGTFGWGRLSYVGEVTMPRAEAPVPVGLTRTFWLTVKLPEAAPPGEYRGSVRLKADRGGAFRSVFPRLDASALESAIARSGCPPARPCGGPSSRAWPPAPPSPPQTPDTETDDE